MTAPEPDDLGVLGFIALVLALLTCGLLALALAT
jgi:hypothetical protein